MISYVIAVQEDRYVIQQLIPIKIATVSAQIAVPAIQTLLENQAQYIILAVLLVGNAITMSRRGAPADTRGVVTAHRARAVLG